MEPISPRVDVAFKKIFGVEENKDLLISLINSIVTPEDQVKDLVLLNPYNPKNFVNEKLSILDIKAQGHNGKRFNIEIQISDEADYDKRALYYWAKLYTEQLQASQDYGKLSKAIGIHILNFLSIPGLKSYHNVYRLQEQQTGHIYFKDIEIHTIELKKFDSQTPDLISRIKNSLDMWVAFLTRHELLQPMCKTQEIKEILPEGSSLQKAMEVLDIINFDSQERETYEAHLKWLRMESCTMRKYEADVFKKGLQEGLEKGLEQGLEKGLEQGLEQGLERGREEGVLQAKKVMALALLAEGLSETVILKITDLTPSELHLIKNSHR